jgi:biotin operon repressor
MTNTMTDRLLTALVDKGEALTPAQIASRFGLAKPWNAIQELRSQGYSIYTNTKTNHRGETVTVYRYGKPSRAMVAAAYAKHGAELFG